MMFRAWAKESFRQWRGSMTLVEAIIAAVIVFAVLAFVLWAYGAVAVATIKGLFK